MTSLRGFYLSPFRGIVPRRQRGCLNFSLPRTPFTFAGMSEKVSSPQHCKHLFLCGEVCTFCLSRHNSNIRSCAGMPNFLSSPHSCVMLFSPLPHPESYILHALLSCPGLFFQRFQDTLPHLLQLEFLQNYTPLQPPEELFSDLLFCSVHSFYC